MQKNLLEAFIRKYYLGGLIEQAVWTCNPYLKTTVVGANRKTMASVECPAIKDFPAIAVFNSTKLLKMLGALDDVVTFEREDKVLRVAGHGVTIEYVLCDKDIIGKVRPLKPVTYDLAIKLNEKLKVLILSNQRLIRQAELFTVKGDDSTGNVNLCFGHPDYTDQVVLEVETEPEKYRLRKLLCFNAKVLIEVVRANIEAPDTVLKIMEKGLASAWFATDEFRTEYHTIKGEWDE